ncbi:conditioned medium-induced protein 4 [Natronobiforma cellulositropha]|uniref:conditioned medium-induced protein 4 n=1 Tax=Natronobiforma cellulositropha TaxID=1679076 RepID=UPI0021D5CB31|nr:conditioned medium-induced protein 4 [Natronobiforma cellulositropha]
MNEKTAELRDIFASVTDGEATVTESQQDTRGTLEQDERTIEERLETVIARMRERYEFESALSESELRAVARGFYEGASDAEIADDLGTDAETVFDARLSLHLVSDEDADGVDLVTVRKHDDATLADEFGVDEERIRRYRRVAAARDESRAANDRYRDEFDSTLDDADLSARMAKDLREDGLADATDGMETDVSF